jgi:serine/threonine-protein phosphatase 2A regulatory subunit B''
MDLDGDGIISMYEMEYFYNEQVEKMEMLSIETLPFQDCLCQVGHVLLFTERLDLKQ